jgi:hypothetical protein
MNCLRTVVVLTLIFVSLAFYPRPAAGQMISREAELKARLLVVLSNFVKWPPDAAPGDAAPLKIGIFGEDPFEQDGVNFLNRNLAAQLADNRVVIERFAKLEDYAPCHILVVSKTTDGKGAFEKIQGQPVLGVGESPGLAREGAIINLVVVQNRVRMELNPDAAKRARLEIDQRIYRLSKIVRD